MRHLDEELSALLDGELDPADSGWVAEHLGGCERCRTELRSLAEVRAAVRGLPALRLPAVTPRADSVSGYRRMARVASIAAAVLVLVGVGAMVAGPSPDPVPAAELSVLFAAYTAEGPAVAADVPATTAADAAERYRAQSDLPPAISGVERKDVRTWDQGTVAYYADDDTHFLVLKMDRPLDTDSFVGSVVRRGNGTYLKGDGADAVIYIWEADGGGMALVGDLSSAEASAVLSALPSPEELGMLERWWDGLSG